MTIPEVDALFRQYLGRSLGPDDIQALGGEANLSRLSPEEFVSGTILPSAEYLSRGGRTETAATSLSDYISEFETGQAQRAAELARQRLGFGEQFARSQADLERQRYKGYRTQLEQDIADAIANVKKQEKEQNVSFLNQQQRLGLRPSGLTVGGLQELATTTGESLSRLERQRANKLAEMALAEQGIELNLSQAIKEAETSRTGIEQELTGQLGSIRQRASERMLKRELEEAELVRKEKPKYELTTGYGGERLLIDPETGEIKARYGATERTPLGKGGGRRTGGTTRQYEWQNKQTALTDLIDDIQSGFREWVGQRKPAWWTENVLLPQLVSSYPELDLNTIKKYMYSIRRAQEFGGE